MDLRQKRYGCAVDISIGEAAFALRSVSSTTTRKVWYAFDLENKNLAMGGLLGKNMIMGQSFFLNLL